mmetsp:Transcript_14902/g.24366  ORF Transcript_14902/g.24366 Transcript_14902/m.24366 type:complete len:261 (-) Transcript_14902:8-790(-)
MLGTCRYSIALFFIFLPFWSRTVRHGVYHRSIEISDTSRAKDLGRTENISRTDWTHAAMQGSIVQNQSSQNHSFPIHASSAPQIPNSSSNRFEFDKRPLVSLANLGSTVGVVHSSNVGSLAQAVLAQMKETFRMSGFDQDVVGTSLMSDAVTLHDVSPCITKKLGIPSSGFCPDAIGCEAGCSCAFGSTCYVKIFKLDQDIITFCPDEKVKDFHDGIEVNIGVCHWNVFFLVLFSLILFFACVSAMMFVRFSLALWNPDD